MAGLATGAGAQDAGEGAATPADPASAPSAGPASGPPTVTGNLSAAQVFALADEARARGDFATAEAAYRALTQDRDLEIRTEARFRLAMMLGDQQHRYGDAALELRRILDDKPGAARVRLELARMQARWATWPPPAANCAPPRPPACRPKSSNWCASTAAR